MNRQSSRFTLTVALCAIMVLAVGGFAQSDEPTDKTAVGTQGMVATAHPLASAAASEILQAGGNAVDAAVAAAFAIGVVEPDGSGIGGGGGMTIWLNTSKSAHYINYYAQAGSEVDRISYDNEDERHTAKAVLIPGTVDGLLTALEHFGTLPRATVMAPAIRYAEDGFAIDATLGQLILDNSMWLAEQGTTAQVFLDEGFPRMEGSLLQQPDLAATLRRIAEVGRDGFYTGPVAEGIVSGLQAGGGALTLADLQNYHSEVSVPLEGTYRGYRVLSARSPQSGSSLIQCLNMLENADLRTMGHFTQSANTLHLMSQVFCMAYADRAQYMGDPKKATVPELGLISKGYARERFAAINQYRMELPNYRATTAGNPGKYNYAGQEKAPDATRTAKTDEALRDGVDDEGKASSGAWGTDMFDSWGAKPKKGSDKGGKATAVKDTVKTTEGPKDNPEYDGHTTHLSVIDRDGNAVALTQTLGTFFGSGITINGVLLNCAMSNFSKTSDVNTPKPGRQPRSSVCPTIVLAGDKPLLVVGSPGAARIICTVAELIVNVIDFGLGADEANAAPRFYCERSSDYLHLEGGIAAEVEKKLLDMGHVVRTYGPLDLFFGGAQLILVDTLTGTYYGSADSRRGGVATGD